MGGKVFSISFLIIRSAIVKKVIMEELARINVAGMSMKIDVFPFALQIAIYLIILYV